MEVIPYNRSIDPSLRPIIKRQWNKLVASGFSTCKWIVERLGIPERCCRCQWLVPVVAKNAKST